MIKSFTDLEQSKKLAEILPIESADMYYTYGAITPDIMRGSKQDYRCYTICWSLTVLLSVLSEYILENNKFYGKVALWCQGISVECDNPVDACVVMIIKLKEQNLL